MAHSDVAGLLQRHGYTELKKVGEGSFGKALLVRSDDGSELICKMVDVSRASKKEQQDAVKEGRLLAKLNHPYIVRYRENFQQSGWLCIVMDFCEGGDLTGRIKEAKKNRQPIPEGQVLRWFTQAIMALKYIHDKHILHRDLKPGNFFLSKDGVMKMGDFGIAKVLACTVAVAQTQIGTPYYLSPELCQEKPYAWASDIWAMGCILYELCALKVPFDAANIPSLVQKICKGALPHLPDTTYSAFVRQLAIRLLNRDPKLRPSTDDILEAPTIKEIMREMLDECREKAVEADATSAPYQDRAGKYGKGDLVEYKSVAHKDWLPAVVIDVDDSGKIVMDLKPNTWVGVEEQAVKIRLREDLASAETRAAPPAPGGGRRPSGPPAAPSRRAGSRAASPSPVVPSMKKAPSQVSSGTTTYCKGDAVEYHSSSHADWLPAVVISTNDVGDIIIDLKPNTWIPKEEQAGKVRLVAPPARGARAPSPAPGSAAGRPGAPRGRESALQRGGAAIVGK